MRAICDKNFAIISAGFALEEECLVMKLVIREFDKPISFFFLPLSE